MRKLRKVIVAVGFVCLLLGGVVCGFFAFAARNGAEPEAMALLAPAWDWAAIALVLGVVLLAGERVERWWRE